MTRKRRACTMQTSYAVKKRKKTSRSSKSDKENIIDVLNVSISPIINTLSVYQVLNYDHLCIFRIHWFVMYRSKQWIQNTPQIVANKQNTQLPQK